MTSATKRHRPLAIVALAGLALLGFGLTLPLGLGPASERTLQGGAVRAAAHDSFSLQSPLTLLDAPRLVVERGTVSLASGGSAGNALYRLLRGGGADLLLEDATLSLHRTNGAKDVMAGAAATIDAEALGPIATALAHLDFGMLTVRDATIVIKSNGAAAATLEDVDAEVTSDRKATMRATGTLRLRGETLSFDVVLVRPADTDVTSLPIRAAINGEVVSAKVEGHLVPDLLQITSDAAELTVPKLRAASRWLGASWPDGYAPVIFEAKGPMEWSEGTVSFQNARFSVDGNTASGSLALRIAGDRPAIEGTLAFDGLNLAPYVLQQQASTLGAATDWLSFLRVPMGLSPSFIREFDADLRISATSVSLSDQALGRCAASISIKDGKLFADLAEVELDRGGTGDGQFGADMTGFEPRYTLRGKLEDFDLGRLVGTYLGRPVVEGLGKVSVELAGAGSTGDAILASLSGSVAIDMQEGARLGVDVPGLEKAARAPLAGQGWTALPKGTTSVDSLVARFAATDGVFSAQAIQANAGDTVVTAAGTISAADHSLDLTVLFTGAGEAASAATKAFRVRGPWSAPAFSAVRNPEKVGLFTGR